MKKLSIIAVSIILAAIGLGATWTLSPWDAEAQNEIDVYYYTTAIQVMVDDEVFIRPDILSSLEPGESWSSLYNDLENGFYIIRVTATSSRQRELVRELGEIGRTIDVLRDRVEDEPLFGFVFNSVYTEWLRLAALGCDVPLRPVDIVGGNVQC